MTYVLRIDPQVTEEAKRIHDQRETERHGSGARFAQALDDCFELLEQNPLAYQLRKGEYRHLQLHRLKYRLVYRVKGTVVYVVQLRHTSRRPSKRFGP